MARRKYYRSSTKFKKTKLVLKIIGLWFLITIFFSLFLFLYYAKDLPRPERFGEHSFYESTKIYDRSGKVLLYEIYGEGKRKVVPLEEISDYLKKAVIAAEDANFYNHFGIDPRGILRAILKDIRIGKPVYGGSTITQQLIRSTFFSTKKTIKRKIREIILAIELDRRYSKDKILEWYLNQIPFGANSYGAEAASQTYFDKPAKELTLEEAATLAALVRAPSYLSPGQNKEKLLERKNYVLDRMAQEGFITQEEADKAKAKEIKFAKTSSPFKKAPHFVIFVLDQLKKKYGPNLDFLKQKGLRIYTSLDWDLQKRAEEVVKEGVKRNKVYNASNAALLAINPNNGEILAMVGSRDYFDKEIEGQVNNTLRYHQPGSAFKPFVYATAFKKGYKATTTVVDEKTNFGKWGGKDYIPENYDGLFRGKITLKQALAQSINVASVKVFVDLAGIPESIKTAHDLGIDNPLPKVPSLVLGGGDVQLIDMVSAYGAFATNGLRVKPVSILRIEDSTGKLIEKNNNRPKRVLRKEVAQSITDILSDNEARAPMFGPRSNLYIKGKKVAAKTGTTQNYRDAWTIGYTKDIVVGVWAGNNDNSPMAKKPAVVIAGSIWNDFMRKVLK